MKSPQGGGNLLRLSQRIRQNRLNGLAPAAAVIFGNFFRQRQHRGSDQRFFIEKNFNGFKIFEFTFISKSHNHALFFLIVKRHLHPAAHRGILAQLDGQDLIKRAFHGKADDDLGNFVRHGLVFTSAASPPLVGGEGGYIRHLYPPTLTLPTRGRERIKEFLHQNS